MKTENLIVEKTYQFGLRIVKLFSHLRKNKVERDIALQLLGSGTIFNEVLKAAEILENEYCLNILWHPSNHFYVPVNQHPSVLNIHQCSKAIGNGKFALIKFYYGNKKYTINNSTGRSALCGRRLQGAQFYTGHTGINHAKDVPVHHDGL